MATPVIVDTNIFFSALLSPHTKFGEFILISAEHDFYISETTVAELFKHKERLVAISHLPVDDLNAAFHLFLRRLTLVKEDSLSQQSLMAAFQLCKEVDPEDSPHVALTIELDGLLWTGDKKLRVALLAQGFNRFFVLE